MARATLLPVNMNASALTGGSWLTSGSPGFDSGSPGGSITAWSGQLGVQYINNGNMVLAVANGATSTTASILVGRKGGGGSMPLFSTFQVTIGASYSGWLGPFSVQDFTQEDSTQYGTAPGGAIGTGGVGYTCIDFANTTSLAVRLLQLIPALP